MDAENPFLSGAYTGAPLPECTDEVCITCSDQMLRMVVESVDDDRMVARGVIDGEPAEVGIELIDGVGPGDVLLCHGGVALQRAEASEVSA